MATNGRRQRRESGITGISVSGYKSLHGLHHIDVKPLTIIAGQNSSGKSSIVQPLLLLKQTLEAPYDPGPLLLNGPNVSVTRIEQILSRGQSRQSAVKDFSVSFSIGGHPDLRLRFGKAPSGDLRLIDLTAELFSDEPLTLHERMSSTDLDVLIPREVQKQLGTVCTTKDDSSAIAAPGNRARSLVPSYSSALRYGAPFSGYAPSWTKCQRTRIRDSSHNSSTSISPNPRRTYPTAAVEKRYPGAFNDYTAGIVAAWQNRKQSDRLTQLRADLERLGLTWKVEARQLDDTSIELLVSRLPHAQQGGARDLVNIADVGFGVSQTLPVLVALLAADPGQLVYLEQPEIHLHPRAQAAFADLLSEAVDRGARILVETHSALLVRAVQTLVARGVMSNEDVALHWFTRDKDSGLTSISSAVLDRFGSFGDWPEDFDEIQLQADHDYLSATEAAEDSAGE